MVFFFRYSLNNRYSAYSPVRIMAATPALILNCCQKVSGFSTSTSSLTTRSRNTMLSRYTISFSTATGSCAGFVSSECCRMPADTMASDLANSFSSI